MLNENLMTELERIQESIQLDTEKKMAFSYAENFAAYKTLYGPYGYGDECCCGAQ